MSTMDQLTHVFREVFDDPGIELTPETTANDIAGWDSLSHSMLILAVENEFEIRFGMKEILGFKNVGDLLKSIQTKTS